MKKQLAILLFLALTTMFSCKEDDPEPADETELITTVELHFTEAGTSTNMIKVFKDLDGPGGSAPTVFDNISLKKNTTYNVKVYLKNESNASAVEDITEEIEEEKEVHQFFYVFNPTSLATHTYLDADANQKPVGLDNTVVTGNAAGSGKMTVILRHQPDKNANGVSAGSPTNAGGETDVEVAFDLAIQ